MLDTITEECKSKIAELAFNALQINILLIINQFEEQLYMFHMNTDCAFEEESPTRDDFQLVQISPYFVKPKGPLRREPVTPSPRTRGIRKVQKQWPEKLFKAFYFDNDLRYLYNIYLFIFLRSHHVSQFLPTGDGLLDA